MPRHSGEERGAAYYRAGVKPAAPPEGMTAEARSIWRSIVWAKPVDWFDGGNFELLRDHCETLGLLRRMTPDLTRFAVGSEEYSRVIRDKKSLTLDSLQQATKLRLTVQCAIERQEEKRISEKPTFPVATVIGGKAAA